MSLASCSEQSYQFRLESCAFTTFLANNRKILLLVNLIFLLTYLLVIFGIEVEFFYPKMIADPFLYYMKGYRFATSHDFVARLAENARPFNYVSLPGFLRYPAYLFSSSFGMQLRFMQVYNLLVLMLIGIVSSYYLNLMLPIRYATISFTLPYLYFLVSNSWQVNTFLPVSDGFFALFVLSAMVVIRSLHFKDRLDRKAVISLLLAAFFVALALLTKYYGIMLLVFAFAAWYPRLIRMKGFSNSFWTIGSLAVLSVLVLYFLQAETFHWYAKGLAHFYRNFGWYDSFLFLVCLSIPCQIIPNFNSLFSNLVNMDSYHFWSLVASPHNTLLAVCGFLITSITIYGIYLLRNKLFPEIVFLLSLVPILSISPDGTARYLSCCQVMFWIFFIHSVHRLIRRLTPDFGAGGTAKIFGGLFLTLAVTGGGMRLYYGSHSNGLAVLQFPLLFSETASVYRSLCSFLRLLPPDSTRLLLTVGDNGKWQAISHNLYYLPDRQLAETVRKQETYLVFDQLTRCCPDLASLEAGVFAQISAFGHFTFTRVYAYRNRLAAAEVFKVETTAANLPTASASRQ